MGYRPSSREGRRYPSFHVKSKTSLLRFQVVALADSTIGCTMQPHINSSLNSNGNMDSSGYEIH